MITIVIPPKHSFVPLGTRFAPLFTGRSSFIPGYHFRGGGGAAGASGAATEGSAGAAAAAFSAFGCGFGFSAAASAFTAGFFAGAAPSASDALRFSDPPALGSAFAFFAAGSFAFGAGAGSGAFSPLPPASKKSSAEMSRFDDDGAPPSVFLTAFLLGLCDVTGVFFAAAGASTSIASGCEAPAFRFFLSSFFAAGAGDDATSRSIGSAAAFSAASFFAAPGGFAKKPRMSMENCAGDRAEERSGGGAKISPRAAQCCAAWRRPRAPARSSAPPRCSRARRRSPRRPPRRQ